MSNSTGTTRAFNILVVEDKPAEQEKARAAVEAAGHTAIVTAAMGEVLEALRNGEIDGVVTDLMFPPDRGGMSQLVHYKQNQPAMGLLVVIAVMASGKPVVICTSSDHHGLDAAWIHDCYLSHLLEREYESDPGGYDHYLLLQTKFPFGWVECKDWGEAVAAVEHRIVAGK